MPTSGVADNNESVLTRAGTLQGSDRNITSIAVGRDALTVMGADDATLNSGSGLLPRVDTWDTSLRIGNPIQQLSINTPTDGTFPITHQTVFASPTGYDIHGQLIVAAAQTATVLDSDIAVSGLPYLAATSNYQTRGGAITANAYPLPVNG